MKYLFVLHSTSINGATNSIVFFIEYLLNKGHEIDYISLDDLSLQIVNLNLKKIDLASIKRIQNRKERFLNFVLSKLYKKTKNKKYDFLYANTIVSLKLAIDLKKNMPSMKLVLHLHEMETIIKQTLNKFEQYNEYISSYIVVSKFTKQYLLDLGISNNKIFLINECSAIPTVNTLDFKLTNEFNVVMLGEAHWRKGDDIFLLIVKQVVEINCDIHFYWIGKVEPYRKVILEQDINKLGISSNVTFIEEVKNPQDYLAKMDLFMLTSREDPFPLAVIESGMLGLPIICFDKATGIQDDILNVGGDVVPYLDINAMSKSVIQFFENKESITLKKNETKEYFNKFSPDRICEQLDGVLISIGEC